MEEKSKGFSLRKKSKRSVVNPTKPQISAPIAVKSDAPTSHRIDDYEHQQPVRQETSHSVKAADLVKRRYSTRVTAIPQGFDVNAPPIPLIPSAFAEGLSTSPPQHGDLDGGGDADQATIAIDYETLRDPDLDPLVYTVNLLKDASQQEIRSFQNTLQRNRNRTSVDLQQNAYKNRTQFIKISKQAEQLKSEMQVLRELMSELKGNTMAIKKGTDEYGDDMTSQQGTNGSSVHHLAGNADFASTRQRKRGSVANLTALHASELQALWRGVEGSQRFLPAVEGRHVLRNSPGWVELNAATWKSLRSMQLFLLNDNLLIASRKRKRIDATANNTKQQQNVPTKLVAERCFPLQEIEVVDLANPQASGGLITPKSQNLSGAINIRVGAESFTFRNKDAEETSGLLINFKKATDELRKTQLAETENKDRTMDNMSYYAARDPSLLKHGDLLRSLAQGLSKDQPVTLIEVDGRQHDLKWVESQIDDLDIHVALQRFEGGVALIEKLRGIAKGLKSNTMAQDLINFKVDERCAKLAEVINRALITSVNSKQRTVRHVEWLRRLGYDQSARKLFLTARSERIEKLVQLVVFEGHLAKYLAQLSFATFQSVRHTVATFQACFPQMLLSSAAQWAREEVGSFNELLMSQLNTVEKDGPVYSECMALVMKNAEVMVEVGLDFGPLIGKSLPLERSPLV